MSSKLMTRRAVNAATMTLGALALIRDASGQQTTERNESMSTQEQAAKITIERKGHILLVGLNRPEQGNKIDPDMYRSLSKTYYDYEHDSELRVLVLFGHGDHFCQGIDVEAFAPVIRSHADETLPADAIDPWGKLGSRLTKPVIVAVHGDTFNIGHELLLACDIRIAASGTKFANTENKFARMPASGATIRFVREAGWAQAMRYLLTGDTFSAEDAFRFGTVQEISADAEATYQKAQEIAAKVAACAPLSIKATLASAHMAIDDGEPKAISQLFAQRSALYGTNDFQEGLRATKERRLPAYKGN